jgi:hypothetical protein
LRQACEDREPRGSLVFGQCDLSFLESVSSNASRILPCAASNLVVMTDKCVTSERIKLKPRKSQEHKTEILGGIILLFISAILPYLGISKDVAWFAGIMSVLLALTVAVIKDHLSTIVEGLADHRISLHAKLSRTATLLSGLDGLPHQFGMALLDRAIRELEQIHTGTIPLDPSSYFHQLVGSIVDAPSGSVVLAVNCIDELRWTEDPREKKYLAENLKASARGVRIERLFIVDRRRLNETSGAGRIEVIRAQLENEQIDAHVVWRDTLLDENDLIKDWTLFLQPNRRLYLDFPDRVDGTRVAHATLVVSNDLIEQYINEFKILSTYKISHDEFLRAITGHLTP